MLPCLSKQIGPSEVRGSNFERKRKNSKRFSLGTERKGNVSKPLLVGNQEDFGQGITAKEEINESSIKLSL